MVVFSYENISNKVAYLGPEKTFTQSAAKKLFPFNELVALQPIRKVVLAVEEDSAKYGVVPLENFYNGEVRETLDSLIDMKYTKIIKETSLSIVHCLGALRGHGTIEQILSKDQALEQCSRYICNYFPNAQTISLNSTAQAAEEIYIKKLKNAAVIANKSALEKYGLDLIEEDICPNNKTRFVIIGKSRNSPSGNDKTLLVIHPIIKDKPGVLEKCLGVFSKREINLEYIQSRPDGKDGYYFYVEIDGHEEDEKVKDSIFELKTFLDPEFNYENTLKILGSYENTYWKKN